MQFLMVNTPRYIIILLISSFLFAASGFHVASNSTLIQKINQKHQFFTTDQLGNLYVVDEFTLTKFDKNGKQLSIYESYSDGPIYSVDASNPLKTVVYHKDFLTIKVLDKTLSEISIRNLRDYGFDMVEAIAYMRNDEIWLYDALTFQLVLLDKNGAEVQRSEVLNVLLQESIQPAVLSFANNQLYVLDKAKGIYLFDAFGGYVKTIGMENVNHFQLIEEKILYASSGQALIYNPLLLTHTEILLPQNVTCNQVMLQKDRMYLSEGNYIGIYDYP